MSFDLSFKQALLASAALLPLLAGAPAEAASLVGLVDGRTIVTIDPASRAVTRSVTITGSAPLVGMDVRPADGMLYGVASDGQIVTINAATGQATPKARLSEQLRPNTNVTADFNPMADRMRVMFSDGTSLRVNVDNGQAVVDGSHKFKEGDANASRAPRVVAGAYTNSVRGTTSTMLFDIDATTGSLVTQMPPNDGVLNTVGSLGVRLNGTVAFNIRAENGANTAVLVSDGAFHTVDLATGRATRTGAIQGLNGRLSHIAWVD